MKSPLVYIILLNYNGYKDTIECLESLEKITYKNYRIVVVDNASIDGSEKIIKNKFPEHIFIQAGSNLGFSGGNNVGIKYALQQGTDYVLLLNNDTIVEPDFLEPLVEEAEKSDQIGIMGGKINYYYDKNIIWSAGGYISDIKGCGYHYGIKEVDEGQYDEKREVTFLTGCIQLIKREVLEKVGLYDEDYFLYFEDVDYCYRTIKNNFKLVYVPTSKIYHKISASTGDESSLALYYNHRNRLLFIKKNIKNFFKKSIILIYFFMTRIIRIKKYNKKMTYVFEGIKDYYINKVGCKNFNS